MPNETVLDAPDAPDTPDTPAHRMGEEARKGPSSFARGRKMGATLLRRIAEAVRGHPMSKHLLFVGPLDYKPGEGGHRLAGPFPDSLKAEEHFEAAKHSFDTHGIFGPFDGTKGGSMISLKPWRVTSVVLQLSNPVTGATRKIDVDPNLNDTVFWQQPGVEKFLIPYYTAIGSLEEGETVRNAMASPDTVVLIHRISSEWVDGRKVKDTGNVPGWNDGMGLFMVESPRADRADFRAVPVV